MTQTVTSTVLHKSKFTLYSAGCSDCINTQNHTITEWFGLGETFNFKSNTNHISHFPACSCNYPGKAPGFSPVSDEHRVCSQASPSQLWLLGDSRGLSCQGHRYACAEAASAAEQSCPAPLQRQPGGAEPQGPWQCRYSSRFGDPGVPPPSPRQQNSCAAGSL